MILYLMKKEQYCRCDEGQYVSQIVSEHVGGDVEDRWFKITCSSVHDLGIDGIELSDKSNW